MSESPCTQRRHILQLLEDQAYSARELAEQIQIPIRDIEVHLFHVEKTVAHQPAKRFCMVPSKYHDCGFKFTMRKRLTTPNRCPTCRSESISSPRFKITIEKKN